MNRRDVGVMIFITVTERASRRLHTNKNKEERYKIKSGSQARRRVEEFIRKLKLKRCNDGNSLILCLGSFEEKAINLWLLFNSLHEPNSNLQVTFLII